MDLKAQIPALVIWLFLLFSSIEDGNAEQRIVCYYTNWSVYRPGTAKFSPQNINPYLCTHLIYAFGGFTKDNTLKPFDKYQDIEKGGYAKFTGLKTYNKNLKTMLAIGGWNEGSSRFSPMVADPDRRKEFVKNSIKFLRQNHFDGLDLDWEYPAFRDGGKPRDRDNYADLVQELREEFERESSKTGRTRLLLTMAVPAGIEYIDKGYDIPRLNNYLDFINLLSYDYHSAFEPAVNHHSPIYPLEEDNEYNYDTELTIDYTIGHLLKSGASSEKIVLGIPTYGRSYTLINEDATDIGSPADGPGEEGDATREKGYLAYYEICESIGKSDEWEVVQPNPKAMGPYAHRENQWVGYDDEDIVRAKARYVIEKKLGGIMFWSIDNDDFRGKCHGRPYPLIEAAKEALLAGTDRTKSPQNNKLADNRKKNRNRGNAINRQAGTGNRRTSTTQAPATRRKFNSLRSNARSRVRANSNADDDEDSDDDEDINALKVAEKPKGRIRSKSRSSNRAAGGGRRKQQQNSRETDEKEADDDNEQSLSNSLTTPEPPTTPDPGSDFKCEDEGFFPHPRDCKKYFWCLDSGPGGLGVVAHQFTCPSGLVFNKAADSCDYPRNVVCPKKTAPTPVTTTKAPTTTTTSPSYSQKSAKRTTTPEPDADEEEYEYYDDDEVEDSKDTKVEPRTTTTSKPLQYKTINRSRPTTTTSAPSSTTTETAFVASTRSYKTTTDRSASFEDEEDPRVLKELIDLIKKAGGIEQLEKQLHYQEKNSGGNAEKNESSGKSTPATISRSLYERVLSRQATRIAGSLLGSLSTTQSSNLDKNEQKQEKNSRTRFVNGPGGAQFEGLDNVPEVKSLRRTNKPTYVTIERHRSSTSESPAEKDEEDEEDAEEDNTDVASSQDRAVSDPPQRRNENRRVTPSYVNIRRPRPSTTTNENDVETKDEDSNANDSEEEEEQEEEEEEESVSQRHRVVKTEEESATPKSRYTNIHRFRSTTSRNNEVDHIDEVSNQNDITTASSVVTTTTTTEKIIPVTEDTSETSYVSSTSSSPSTISKSSGTPAIDPTSTSVDSSIETSSVPSTTDITLKLVEDSATEILFTTVPASPSSPETSQEPFTKGPTIAVVSQPRPFGFPRRVRPGASTTTTTTTSATSPGSVTPQSRPKVDEENLGLTIAKETIDYSTAVIGSIADQKSTFVSTAMPFFDVTIENKTVNSEQNDRAVSKNRQQNIIYDLSNEDNNADDNDSLSVNSSSDKEIFDNDVLESEEIQHRSLSSTLAAAAATTESHREISANEAVSTNIHKSIKRIDVPVQILDNTNGEEIAELVLLRIPENKLNSAILKPVFRVKILQPEPEAERKHAIRNDIESGMTSGENSLENELYENRRRPSRRRRVRINSSQASPSFDTPANKSVVPFAENIRPRTRQRIVKARRRNRVKEASSDESEERTVNYRVNERISPTDDPTTIRVTTMRGNFSASFETSSSPRGFYITKSSSETSTSMPSAVINDLSTKPTEATLTTGNDFLEQLTEKTELPAQTRQPLIGHQPETIYSTTTEDISTYNTAGTTFGQLEIATKISDEMNSTERQLKTMADNNFETVTSDYASTVGDRIAESFFPMITTTTGGKESMGKLAIDSTINTDSTTVDYAIMKIDGDTATDVNESTENVAETLKTSENGDYRSATTLAVDGRNVHMRTESKSVYSSHRTGTETPEIKTTDSIDETTTTVGGLNRGRIRFTTTVRPVVSSATFSRDHQRRTTKSSDSNDSGINSVSRIVSDDRNRNYNEKEEPTSTTVGEIPTREYTSRFFLKSRSRQASTTESIRTVNFTINSIIPKESTPPVVTEIENIDKTTEGYKFADEENRSTTHFVETTDYSSNNSRSFTKIEQNEKITKSYEADDTKINSLTPIDFAPSSSASTEAYDKIVGITIDGIDTTDKNTNFEKTIKIPYTTKLSHQNFSDAEDPRLNSVTPSIELSTMSYNSIPSYKTVEPTNGSTDTIDSTTRFVKIDDNSYSSGSTLSIENNSQGRTTIFGIEDTTVTLITPASDSISASGNQNEYDSTTTSEVKEETETRLSDSKPFHESSTTTKFFTTDDNTISSMVVKELPQTRTTTTKSHDIPQNRDGFTDKNDQNPNVMEATESQSQTTSEKKYTTTESYDETTISLTPTKIIEFITNGQKPNPTTTTISLETIITPAANEKLWIHNQRGSSTKISESDETPNISSDATLTMSLGIASTTNLPTTTEFYETPDNTARIIEVGTADDQTNQQRKFPSEALQTTEEKMSTMDQKIEDTTERIANLTEKLNDRKTTQKNLTIENVETTTAITASPENNHNSTITEKTKKMYDEEINRTTNSSDNSVTLETKHQNQDRTRGRVRFTNFAGKTDETGRARRPVKQVVVRRRLANPPKNPHPSNITNKDGTPKFKPQEIVKKQEPKNIPEKKLSDQEENVVKPMRRRVVVYRGRSRVDSVPMPPPTTTPMTPTTTTEQTSGVSSDDFSDNNVGTRRRKWRKRLVSKRAKNDDMDDQIIAETGDYRRAIIHDPVDQEFRAINSRTYKMMAQEIVSSVEGNDEDIGDGEVNIYKSSGAFLRRPGTLKRTEGLNRLRNLPPATSLPIIGTTGQPLPFSKIRQIENTWDGKTEDQSGRAQELAVTVADPPEIRVTPAVGRQSFRATTRKISTTISPRTEAPSTSLTTTVPRRRQRPRSNDKIVESVSIRPRRPAIIDYDYYVDDEVRLVVKPELKDKLFVTRKGGIRCLDQGNFAHPTSCKKFITCARMVNGQVVGTEYTCPDKLSFDPVGGICNWSAGLGCEDKPTS